MEAANVPPAGILHSWNADNVSCVIYDNYLGKMTLHTSPDIQDRFIVEVCYGVDRGPGVWPCFPLSFICESMVFLPCPLGTRTC